MSEPMNRADKARQAAFLQALAEQAKARVDAIKAELSSDARAELERDGTAPSWRIPGLGTIPLCLTADAVVVDDERAYLDWVAKRYPMEVEEIVRVRPAFDEALRKAAVKRGDPPCTDDGEVIPGLVFRPGGQPKGIQLRLADAAKVASAAAARAYLDAMPPLPADLTP